MPFVLNGNTLSPPSTHKWVVPQSYGTSGRGQPLYPGVFAYEMYWAMLPQSEFNLLTNAQASGSAVVQLPEWRGLAVDPNPYDFQTYSGTYLSMPEWQSYFEGHYEGVRVLVNNVTV